MSDQQLSLYSGFNTVSIRLASTGKWYWHIRSDDEYYYSDNWFNSAADAEQDLIAFLKNYEGFRNG